MELVHLLQIYPILESVVSQISYSDLLHLSRANSNYRAALHGIAESRDTKKTINNSNVHINLQLSMADTKLWQHLKSISQLECAEASHTKGKDPKGCRMCSKPVCNACIVKASFNKKENTFGNRKRDLCEDCWAKGIPHKERLHFHGDNMVLVDYYEMGVCRCTARDGTLCFDCKNKQNELAITTTNACAGKDCNRNIEPGTQGGRICLWCNLALPGSRSKDDSQRRRDYESKYRADYDRPPKEIETYQYLPQKIIMSFDDQRAYAPANPTVQSPDQSTSEIASASPTPSSDSGSVPPYGEHEGDIMITDHVET